MKKKMIYSQNKEQCHQQSRSSGRCSHSAAAPSADQSSSGSGLVAVAAALVAVAAALVAVAAALVAVAVSAYRGDMGVTFPHLSLRLPK